MNTYEIEFSYNLPESGSIELEADTPEEARQLAIKEIEDTYGDDIEDIIIGEIRALDA